MLQIATFKTKTFTVTVYLLNVLRITNT